MKAIDSRKKSKRFTYRPSLKAFKRYISNMNFFRQTVELRRFFCHPQISLICLIHFSLPNLYFYSIRSVTMFLKVLSKVNIRVLTKPKLFLIIDLLPFTKPLELLAVNHSSSERTIIFVPRLFGSPMFWLFCNLHGCAFPLS